MRLETAAAKFDQRVWRSLPDNYDFNAADTRELLQEAARRIKELEGRCDLLSGQTEFRDWQHDTYACGNDL